jgi:hypothetical protein
MQTAVSGGPVSIVIINKRTEKRVVAVMPYSLSRCATLSAGHVELGSVFAPIAGRRTRFKHFLFSNPLYRRESLRDKC